MDYFNFSWFSWFSYYQNEENDNIEEKKESNLKHNRSVDDISCLDKNDIKKDDAKYNLLLCGTCSCCIMSNIDDTKNIKAKIKNKVFLFCSDECYDNWLKNPFLFNYNYSFIENPNSD